MQNLSAQILEVIPFSVRIIRRLSSSVLKGRVTIHHLRILVLVQEGMGQKGVSETLQVSEAAISKTIASLVEKKLLKKKIGVDKRSREITLTASGTRILKLARDLVEEQLIPELDSLKTDEKKKLKEGLEVLQKVMTGVKEKL